MVSETVWGSGSDKSRFHSICRGEIRAKIPGTPSYKSDFGINFGLGILDTEYTDVGNAIPTQRQSGMEFNFARELTYDIGLQWNGDFDNGGGF